MDYKEKYIKYKTKYIKLKNLVGGNYLIPLNNCLPIDKENISEKEKNEMYEGIMNYSIISINLQKKYIFENYTDEKLFRNNLNKEIDFYFNESEENYNNLMEILKLYHIDFSNISKEKLIKNSVESIDESIKYIRWFLNLGNFFKQYHNYLETKSFIESMKKFNLTTITELNSFCEQSKSESNKSINLNLNFPKEQTYEDFMYNEQDIEDILNLKKKIFCFLIEKKYLKLFYDNIEISGLEQHIEYSIEITGITKENINAKYFNPRSRNIYLEVDIENTKKYIIKIEKEIQDYLNKKKIEDANIISVNQEGIMSYLQVCFIFLYRLNKKEPRLFTKLINCLICLIHADEDILISTFNNFYTNTTTIYTKKIEITKDGNKSEYEINGIKINLLQYILLTMPLLKFCFIYNNSKLDMNININSVDYNFSLKKVWEREEYIESINSGLKFYKILMINFKQTPDQTTPLYNLLYKKIGINIEHLDFETLLIKIKNELEKCPETALTEDDFLRSPYNISKQKFNNTSYSHYLFDARHFITHLIGLNVTPKKEYVFKEVSNYYDFIIGYLDETIIREFKLNFFTVVKLGYYELYKLSTCKDKDINFTLLNDL